MKPFTIAITGINAVDNPGPGTGIARSLREDKELPTQIIGLAYDAMEPGLYMDWLFDRRYLMPYPSSDPEVLMERLRQIQQQTGLDAVIPNFDMELPLYQRCAKELESLGIQTYLPTRAQFGLRNKVRLTKVAAEFGVKTPQTLTATSSQELREAIASLGLPLMIKGPYYVAYRVSNEAEALQRFHQLAAQWQGYPIIIQQFVTGLELNLVGIGDGKGSHLGLVAVKKMSVTELGKIWSGVTIHHNGLIKAAEAFLQHTHWKGPFELECISGIDGMIYLIEINPRFPAWTYFATGVGINLPARLVRAMLGIPLPPLDNYEAGKLFMRYTYEMVTDATPLQTLVTLGER